VEYVLHILTLVVLYAILAMSLNLLSGYAGQISLAHAAFYGIGAYTAALTAVSLGTPFFVGLLLASMACAVGGAVIGLPSVRVRGDYLVIATFSLQVITGAVLNNWTSVTGGPRGVYGIPPCGFFGFWHTSRLAFLGTATIVAGAVFVIAWRAVRSPVGRAWKAIREDETFAQSMGKNVAASKVTVFALSAAMAGAAGALYAHYFTYIDPSAFRVTESILIVSMVVVGGAGRLCGPLVGAALLVMMPEALRVAGLPTPAAAKLQGVLYGLLLVLVVMLRPEGLWPSGLRGGGNPGTT